MSLKQLRQQMKGINPFLTYQFFGVNNCLAEKGDILTPLSVCANPPSVSLLIQSGLVTNLLLRYSKTYADHQKKLQEVAGDKGFVEKVKDEIEEGMFSNEQEQAKQVSLLMQLASSYLMVNTVKGYYKDNEPFELHFVQDTLEADDRNEEAETAGRDEVYVSIQLITDEELMAVAGSLINNLPAAAEIPLKDETVIDGQIEEGVTSVQADSLAKFPRRLRQLPVEDVPKSGGGTVGNYIKEPAIRG